MKQRKNQRASFSKEITQLVVAGFGIAFFLIFAASVLLLYLSENDKKVFWIKAAGMLLVYLALYILYSIFVTGRIKKLFLPLDRLAWGLMRDRVFVDSGEKDLKALADSLRAQAEQMSSLSRELENTREDLDDASRESMRSRDSYRQLLGRTVAETERIREREEELEARSGRMADRIDAALLFGTELKEKRNAVYARSEQLICRVEEKLRQYGDTENDFEILGSSYALLDSMHSDAQELTENLYSEMTALQSLATQVNLYVMNTSLEISRAGAITISAVTAMDEIKELSATINEKTDNVLLLIIRIRNCLKLAMDQSGECRGKGAECGESLSAAGSGLSELKESADSLAELCSQLSDEAGRLSSGMEDLRRMEEERERSEAELGTDVDRLSRFVKDWRRREEDHTDPEGDPGREDTAYGNSGGADKE